MTDADLPRAPNAFRLWREAQHTQSRTRLGGIYYLLAWLLVWGFSAAPGAHLLLGLGTTAFFSLILILRWLHRLPAGHAESDLRRWLDLQAWLVCGNALGWGLVQAWTLQTIDFAPSQSIAAISTIAISAAMAFTFSMDRSRGALAILLLYLPGLAVLLPDAAAHLGELATLALYLSYLLLAQSRSHREYCNTLDLELQLLEQRERMEALGHTDGLTQLGNRHRFNSLFPALLANALRHGSPLSLVLLDIDFFKKVNDEYGHAVGDECLRAFAERMCRAFRRDSDALLRLGGEEFGVLMPDTPLEQARQLAESFRAELAASGFSCQQQWMPLTASLGVGTYDPLRGGSAEALYKRVDDALYRAKEAGRDRLVLAQPEG
ncbi:GGDEF domain-containing protein [Pseudomonas cavernicola]|uniref:diguanylate cyclase n=1 Tax=Pseudomonas cavernicola TaxID=2320866 RepID=A0A418XLH8_9PSED|nr:GGDEF domain-containing protein [Pseudomonas cavernicola]RJG13317.1 GGDEF domain-containing protein [Pseudomonas cavernicola]